MSVIFQNPALKGFAGQIETLLKTLPASFPSVDAKITRSTLFTVFLTGATGFLSACLLRDLLTRSNPPINEAIAHVQALDLAAALDRVT
ncbi:hypothetical protein BDZ45DRAFT_751140 [Acephala macrosclerotiorum]|nr:hypothetical protein BDZ45DRAFT_751140 [Acephala macrosclerotiorum]